MLSLDARASQSLLQEPFIESDPAVSPDGRWLAYASNESGQFEVYVRPFPNVEEGKWPISPDGGRVPVWGPDSRELFYRRLQDAAMMQVAVEVNPSFTPGAPSVMFDGSRYLVAGRLNGPPAFDISPDGQRFLMLTDADSVTRHEPQIIVVENWHKELLERVPIN